MTVQISNGPPTKDDKESPGSSLGEIAILFLRLGLTAFGGPAAHIAMMRDEVVERRKWLDDQQFLDLIGATNLIPGPNSTEMAIHTGYLRSGFAGLVVAGLSFILPAMLIVLGLSWVYVRFGATPTADQILYGIKPVVIAIIAQALLGLGKKAIKGPLTALVGLAALVLFFLNFNLIALFITGGILVMLVHNLSRLKETVFSFAFHHLSLPIIVTSTATTFSFSTLFLTFLKIGSILYGSGYVLLAFLRADFVNRLGWLTDQQLIDAVAIGQVTPGPVFTTATFVGYVLGGLPGALLATLGIFLPSFFFVAISNPFIPRLRQSPWAGSFLDGVNVASLGLMAAVTWQLGQAAIIDSITILIALVSALLLLRYKVNSTWLILGGALTGWLKLVFS